MGSKFKGSVGIAAATDASSVVAPVHFLRCGNASIDDTPIVYETDSIISPEVEYGIGGGHKHAFSVTGIELPVGQLGYLLWLALGGQSGTGPHTLSPAAAQSYLCLQVDRGIQIGATASKTTQILVGAKIGSLRLEIPKVGFAKASISGVGCDLGTEGDALVPTIDSGANNAPVSWQAIKDGYFKLGYPTTPAQDDEITRVALEITRELDDNDTDLSTDQPVAIYEGKRSVTWEVDKPFRGTSAKSAYDAWKAQSGVGIDVNLTCGSYSAVLSSDYTRITGGFAKEIGASAEAIMGTLALRAHRNVASVNTLDAVITDGVTGVQYS